MLHEVLPGKRPDAPRLSETFPRGYVTQEESWESLLPSILEDAGITATGDLEVWPLAGGVSSDIVRVKLPDGREFCAKRALRKLRVTEDWQVPTERNHFEAAWFRLANAIVPDSAPAVLGEDRQRGIALLAFLPPDKYVLWKDELLAGRYDPSVSRSVANVIGRIHTATLMDSKVAMEFATDALFDALRLAPYLRTISARHPEIASQVLACLETTRSTKIALVHGDLSPKNILVNRRDAHPVILDAECAWYGDPVFDVAFCLNHLVLKSIHMPMLAEPLLSQAREFFGLWLAHFPPEMQGALEMRTATLLPCLMLARVDGKSPVEYLTPPSQQLVRDIAIPLIRQPPPTLDAISDDVAGRLGRIRQGAN